MSNGHLRIKMPKTDFLMSTPFPICSANYNCIFQLFRTKTSDLSWTSFAYTLALIHQLIRPALPSKDVQNWPLLTIPTAPFLAQSIIISHWFPCFCLCPLESILRRQPSTWNPSISKLMSKSQSPYSATRWYLSWFPETSLPSFSSLPSLPSLSDTRFSSDHALLLHSLCMCWSPCLGTSCPKYHTTCFQISFRSLLQCHLVAGAFPGCSIQNFTAYTDISCSPSLCYFFPP